MNKQKPHPGLERVISAQLGKSEVREITVSVFHTESGETYCAASGSHKGEAISENTLFFIASTTKLFATIIMCQLRAEGRLSFDDKMAKFLTSQDFDSLLILNGTDKTGDIDLRHLLSHTSGLPDYFEQKRMDGTNFADALLNGQDRAWSVYDVLIATRGALKPLGYSPGQTKKAFYSDTNFQLLGAVIEAVTGISLAQNVEARIAQPLQLNQTYLYSESAAKAHLPVLPMRNGTQQIHIPNTIESTRLDGGGVSNSTELLTLIRAIFDGQLFPAAYLNELQNWRPIFFPLHYGVGIMKFELPRIFSLLQEQPSLIGHSGISGAFAFHCPAKSLYIAGTVNQLANRGLPYRFMLKIAAEF